MNKSINSHKLGRFTICATTGALIALPLLASSTLAAPPSHAPAHGYYKEKNKNKGNKGKGNNQGRGHGRDRNGDWRDRDRDDRDRDDDDWRDRDRNGDWRDRDRDRDDDLNDGTPVGDHGTMTGTVIRSLGGGRFEVRADDNRTFMVRSSANETRRVRTGDRVELVGYLTDQNVFIADSVRVIGDSGTGIGNGNIDFYGTVLSASSRTRLTVRADDGQTFYVTTRNSVSSSINRGDRVRVTGLSTNRNVVSSATVVEVGNNDNGNPIGQTVSFNGTVQTANNRGGVLVVRGDDGRTYNVRPNNSSTFDRGERVRIVGVYRNGAIYATSVTRL